MPGDPFAGLFKRCLEIDLPGGPVEMNARKLAQRGLICIEERLYVRCVNPLDHDQRYVKQTCCPGRIYVSRHRDEANGDYQCPDCSREVYPSIKQQRASIRIIPDEGAMRMFVLERLEKASQGVEERPTGLYRIPIQAGEVRVCLVDCCGDPAVFTDTYSYRDTLVFVVGNDRDYLRRLPPGIPTYRLAELALDKALSNFHRTLRQLMGRKSAAPVLGAVVPSFPRPQVTLTIMQPPRSRSSQRQLVRITVRPGTRWSDITFYLVDGETLAIHVPGQQLKRYHHHELGMANTRTGKPSRKWEIIEQLCSGYGQLSWTGTARQFSAFKEQVSRLRLILQEVFGLKADPFRQCSRRDGLHAAFQAFPDLPDSSPVQRTSW